MFEVLHARHRKDYFRLAIKFWVSPQHIWELAHGEEAKNTKDKDILHELLKLGIVRKHKHHKDKSNE